MYNILVPIDFSKTSFAAFNYAANFAQLIPETKVTLLHVINGNFISNEEIAYGQMFVRRDVALSRLKYFYGHYPDQVKVTLPKVDVETDIKFGVPGFTISDYTKQKDIDLVIMGTRDKHGIFDRILGSASSIAVRLSKCPVILIHEDVKFNAPEKIVFGFDQKSDIEDAISDFRYLNNILKAKTDFVHVNKTDNEDLSEQKSDIVEELFEKNDPQFSFEIKSIKGKSVHTALQDYCLFEKADMLAMMHREEGIFGTLFKSQHSVKMAQEFHLPVIVFHEKD